jgi:hypothetical protein
VSSPSQIATMAASTAYQERLDAIAPFVVDRSI